MKAIDKITKTTNFKTHIICQFICILILFASVVYLSISKNNINKNYQVCLSTQQVDEPKVKQGIFEIEHNDSDMDWINCNYAYMGGPRDRIDS